MKTSQYICDHCRKQLDENIDYIDCEIDMEVCVVDADLCEACAEKLKDVVASFLNRKK